MANVMCRWAVWLISFLFCISCQMTPCRTIQTINPDDSLQHMGQNEVAEAASVETPVLKKNIARLVKPKGTVFVYKDTGGKQCGETPSIPLEVMAHELEGILIISQSVGHDGMMRPQVCGASTGAINVYEINSVDLMKALKKGFHEKKK